MGRMYIRLLDRFNSALGPLVSVHTSGRNILINDL